MTDAADCPAPVPAAVSQLAATASAPEVTAAFASGAVAVLIDPQQPATCLAEQIPLPPLPLSDREAEVLQLVADGCSNPEIGAQLDLSPATVKAHLSRIGRKLGTGDRAHMVLIGLRCGAIDAP